MSEEHLAFLKGAIARAFEAPVQGASGRHGRAQARGCGRVRRCARRWRAESVESMPLGDCAAGYSMQLVHAAATACAPCHDCARSIRPPTLRRRLRLRRALPPHPRGHGQPHWRDRLVCRGWARLGGRRQPPLAALRVRDVAACRRQRAGVESVRGRAVSAAGADHLPAALFLRSPSKLHQWPWASIARAARPVSKVARAA